MKESEFIEQNKKKWLEFETGLKENIPDPAKTTKLFAQITDDLAFARTFYKNRSVRLYLNAIARLLFNELTKAGAKKTKGIGHFFKTELPLTLYAARKAMLVSLLVFIGSFAIGVLSSRHDMEFSALILGADYIHMTNQNIAKGDPMAVYKKETEIKTFIPILLNNLKVDLITFFSGLVVSLGSLIVMVSNGIMVGVFQYYFISKGVFWESFLGIWTHGSLEIPTIILSGGAGLMLGKGLLFPGTFSRFQAFKLSANQGLKIIIGVAPLTLIAAFVESFITRHTGLPDIVRLGFILLSFSSVIVYYVYYPRKVFKIHQQTEEPIADHDLLYKEELPFDKTIILKAPEIITTSFKFFFSEFHFFWRVLLIGPLLAAILIAADTMGILRSTRGFYYTIRSMIGFEDYPALALLSICFIVLTVYYVTIIANRKANNDVGKTSFFPIHYKFLASLFISCIILAFIVYSRVDYSITITIVLLPFFLFVSTVSYLHNLNYFESFGYAFSLLAQSFIRFLANGILFYFLALLTYFFVAFVFRLFFIQNTLVWIFTDNKETVSLIHYGIFVFEVYFSFAVLIALLSIANTLLYFSLNEIYTADTLIKKIKSIAPGV